MLFVRQTFPGSQGLVTVVPRATVYHSVYVSYPAIVTPPTVDVRLTAPTNSNSMPFEMGLAVGALIAICERYIFSWRLVNALMAMIDE